MGEDEIKLIHRYLLNIICTRIIPARYTNVYASIGSNVSMCKI